MGLCFIEVRWSYPTGQRIPQVKKEFGIDLLKDFLNHTTEVFGKVPDTPMTGVSDMMPENPSCKSEEPERACRTF